MCQCIIQSKISFKSHRSCDFGIRIQERQREIIWKLLGNFLTFILRAAQKKLWKNDWKLCVKIIRFVCFYVDELSAVLFLGVLFTVTNNATTTTVIVGGIAVNRLKQ